MESFILEKFYLFFQGIILFQSFFLGILYFIYRKKDILFYAAYLCLQTIYFFWNAPHTFFNLNDEVIFNSSLYLYINTPLIIVSNLAYIFFLWHFFSSFYYNKKWQQIVNLYTLASILLIITSLILIYFRINQQFIFYTVSFLSTSFSIYLLTQIKRDNIKNANWVRIGILFNITGNAVTILMIVLDRYGIKNVFTTDYPLFFMRCGILADTVFYLIAILKKWQWQEKELAMQQIEKKLAIEKVRNQISSRLHDDIGSTLSGVSMYSYLANDLLVRGNHIEAKKSLSIIKSSVDEMVEKLGDLVWSVNKEEDSLPLLINRLEEYGVNLCSVKNIAFKKSGVVNNFDLSAEQRYHLYLFCKEALNNAVKYSEAALLQLRVIEIDHQLEISISDNGKGFDVNSVSRGNGLDNMQKRAQEIGADFNIKSKIGEGCEILLKVKIT